MNGRISQALTVITALALLSWFAPVDAIAGKAETRLRAHMVGENSESGKADFRARGDRRQFSVEVEALAQDLGVGRVLDVTVGGTNVGQITMLCADSAAPCMSTQGELEFDDTVGPNDMDDPFPPNFPSLTSGSSIDVQGVLGGVF